MDMPASACRPSTAGPARCGRGPGSWSIPEPRDRRDRRLGRTNSSTGTATRARRSPPGPRPAPREPSRGQSRGRPFIDDPDRITLPSPPRTQPGSRSNTRERQRATSPPFRSCCGPRHPRATTDSSESLRVVPHRLHNRMSGSLPDPGDLSHRHPGDSVRRRGGTLHPRQALA